MDPPILWPPNDPFRFLPSSIPNESIDPLVKTLSIHSIPQFQPNYSGIHWFESRFKSIEVGNPITFRNPRYQSPWTWRRIRNLTPMVYALTYDAEATVGGRFSYAYALASWTLSKFVSHSRHIQGARFGSNLSIYRSAERAGSSDHWVCIYTCRCISRGPMGYTVPKLEVVEKLCRVLWGSSC